MAQPSTQSQTASTPKAGEIYRCKKCGMELKVTADCTCKDPSTVRLECCGQELARL
jgi:hypothetical protein